MKVIVCFYFVCTFICLALTHSLQALSQLPYISVPKQYFSVSAMVDTNSARDDGAFVANDRFFFNFENVAYGFSFYPMQVPKTIDLDIGELAITLPSGEKIRVSQVNNTNVNTIKIDGKAIGEELKGTLFVGHHFMWEPFDFSIPWIRSHMRIQLGMLNFGLPEKAFERPETMKYNRYFKNSYVTWRLQPFYKLPFYMYYSLYNTKADSELNSGYALSIEREKMAFKLEKTPDLTFIGLDAYLFSGLIMRLGAYPLDSEVEKLAYQPKYFFEIEVRSKMFRVFKKKQKVKPKFKQWLKPLPIDKQSLIHMEKGSLDYYNMQYRDAMFHYEKIISKYPNFPLAWQRLGSIYFELGLYEKAKSSWQEVLKYEPANKDTKYYLERVEQKLLKPSAAVQPRP